MSLVTITSGIEQALHFAGSPMDGPLQLYNAMRRIAAGQQPGVDFQFFHGLGVPFLHYLPYRLFGGGFAAAEITRQLLTAIAYPLVSIAFFRAFTMDWRKTLALSAIVMSLSIALRLSTILVAINSLLGIRSLAATLVPIAWYALRDRRARGPLTGVLIGVSLLTGTEQGMAVLVAYLAVGVLLAGADPTRERILELAVVPIVAIATMLALLLAIGGPPGLAGALRYNFQLLPKDQYWYFGAPPNPFISGWSSAVRLMIETPLVPITLAAAAVLGIVNARRAWRPSGGGDRMRHAAIAMLCLYGLVSSASLLGIFLVGYIQPCARAVLLAATLELSAHLQWREGARGIRPAILGIVAVGLMVLSVPVIVGRSLLALPHVAVEHVAKRRGIRFEGVWPRANAIADSIISHAGLTPSAPVWSTYAGLLEARHGMFHPDFDYIIHALGPENRERYVRRFIAAKPRIVQTVLPQFSPFEIWLEQTSWPFYRELLLNYRTAAATPWSIFWERVPISSPQPFLVFSGRMAADQDSMLIPLPRAGTAPPAPLLLEVEVAYRTRNPLGFLPVIGALPRYLVELEGTVTNGPVTLNPFVGRSVFPLVTLEGSSPVLRFRTRSLLPAATLEVSEVRVSAMPVTQNILPWFRNHVAAEIESRPTRSRDADDRR